MTKKSILIIDDDQFILDLISQSFPNDTYTIFKATNVNDALEINLNHKIDLVITDIIMPDNNGIALIDAIKKRDHNIPVIAMSGGGGDINKADQYVDFALYFADDTLTKPFSKNDILEAVENLLNNESGDFLQYL